MTASLTLGPVLYNWEATALRDFYFRIADEAPVDRVHVGEVVCSKRAPFFLPYLEEVLDRLESAGKEVVLSTLAMPVTEREVAGLADIVAVAAEREGCLVEANDVACLALLEGRPHVVGPFVNVYNEATLAWLAARGAVRVCLPAELAAPALAALAGAGAGAGAAALEVQVFGRLPLAVSTRCYHARAHGLSKDGCQYVCGQDGDGMVVRTLDGDPFLAVNGVQVTSFTYCDLSDSLAEMTDMGIAAFRLWPQRADMVQVAKVFRALLDGSLEGAGAAARLRDVVGDEVSFSNGFFRGREGAGRIPGPAEPTGPVE